jgi:shikimate dehydrogenase
MIDVYRAKELDEKTAVYGIAAGDTSYTISPIIQNAAFQFCEMNSVFVPLQVADLDAFMRSMVKPETREVELNFHGFSVTNPHKQAIIKYLDSIDETAGKIGAVNTIKIENGKLHGFNTDAAGFIEPLIKRFGDLANARVAVAGAGGAARACIYALQMAGAEVTLFARNQNKARDLADEFGIVASPLTTDHRPLTTDFDIIVNATPLGTKGEFESESIAVAEQLRGAKLVYDIVYNPLATLLLRESKKAGIETIGGIEMLVAQGAKQFEIWTGAEAPVDVMTHSVLARMRG